MYKKVWLVIYYGFARYLPPTHKNIMGRFGGWLRKKCCQHVFKTCGKDVNIEHMAEFGNGYNIELGEHSCLGIHCHYPNDIKIGDCVMFGPNSYFFGRNTHNFDDLNTPICSQGKKVLENRTEIGNDVWLGRQCIMLGGKKIGDHCIIGAGSIICKDIPDWAVAAGNPIKIIRDRRNGNK